MNSAAFADYVSAAQAGGLRSVEIESILIRARGGKLSQRIRQNFSPRENRNRSKDPRTKPVSRNTLYTRFARARLHERVHTHASRRCMPAGVIDISKYAMADRSQSVCWYERLQRLPTPPRTNAPAATLLRSTIILLGRLVAMDNCPASFHLPATEKSRVPWLAPESRASSARQPVPVFV